ncbi:class I SAM-dependent methyltransferase [Obesumbacterium proteus]|uniref:class I SAM-dependent methyltransferase n=1 Tax=Obesumbacterium proteus TaxID=82983 RepID=UPI00103385AD|nr:class I SAM-dependent methyltransferase [Obesumbacterium proteus]TBL71941.1 class I SAM-dependent methyltransferase [Obesumbacterium proteus]
MTSPADNIIPLYQQNSAFWDSQRNGAQGDSPRFEVPWLERFLAQLPANGHILDIGCGSGEPIAGYFIRQGFNITGIDGASAQIARCRERFPQQRWLVNDMRTLDLGTRFDGIIAWDSFFHLSQSDQRKMFAVFLAHAADRAALMFTSGPDQGEAIGEFCGKLLFHASLSPTEYINLLHQHQFSVVEHRVEDPECGFHTVWLAVRGA